MKFVIR